MDYTFSSTRIAAQLEKIRQIQRGYRYVTDYGTRSDGSDAEVSDDGLLDHQSKDRADDIHNGTFDHVDNEHDELKSRKCSHAPSHGSNVSGSGSCMSDTESDDESRASDSSEGSVSDCGDNEMDIMEDSVYGEYFKDIKEEYKTLASIDPHGYAPLRHERREIRLLLIMPREFRLVTGRELVSCFTVTRQFDTAEPFTGLSYVWGDEKDTLPIMLNNKVVQVTRNLATALRHIEHDHGRWGVRVFWVDALCINQKDNPEKSHQVQMMGDIYRRATRVFSWLGRATRLTVPAFRWIRKSMDKLISLYKISNPSRVFDQEIRKPMLLPDTQMLTFFAAVHRTFTAKILLPRRGRLLDEVFRLCSNPYWQRIWILQEISTYSTVGIHLGCNSLPLWYVDMFCCSANVAWLYNGLLQAGVIPTPLSQHSQLSPHIWSLLKAWQPLSAIRIGGRASTRQRLLHMLEDTVPENPSDMAPFFRSTKPEDRVFALLGLAGDAPDLGLTPDYAKGVKEIYTETASSILRVYGELDLLSFSQLPKRIEGLPSWVPDWSMILPSLPLSRPDEVESAAGPKQTSQIPRVNGNNLTLTGVIIDTVRSTLRSRKSQRGDSLDNAAARAKQEFILSALEFINHHISNPTRSYASYMNTVEVLYHICLPNVTLRWVRSRSYGFSEFLRDCEVLLRAQRIRPIPDYIYSLMHRLENGWLRGRRVFATTRGFIGLGSAYVQEGDVVVILHGGKVPFLLRPVREGRQGHYELMGEAYMYGMMEGEFMWTNPPTQEFTLV